MNLKKKRHFNHLHYLILNKKIKNFKIIFTYLKKNKNLKNVNKFYINNFIEKNLLIKKKFKLRNLCFLTGNFRGFFRVFNLNRLSIQKCGKLSTLTFLKSGE